MFQRTTAINKIAKMKRRLRIIPGGTSAGKTYSILPILITYATKTPNLEISVVSESLPHLRKGALRDFKKIMKESNRWVAGRFNSTLLTYTFNNGSYIEFFSCDNSEKARGPRRDILYVNECNRIKFDIFNELYVRTKMVTFVDFNPTHRFWVHEHYSDDEDAEWLTLTYLDNEATPSNVVRMMDTVREKAKYSTYWANWWLVYGLGQLGSLEGVIFKEGDNWELIDKIPRYAQLIGYGLDFGFVNDPTSLVAIYKCDGKKIYSELIYERGLTNSQLANKMKNLEIRKDIKIVADNAEQKSIAELRTYGYSMIPCEKGPDSIKHGIDNMQQEKFYVTKRSTNFIEELRNYMWDEDKRTGKKLNIPCDAYNHCIDAARYVHSKLFSKTKVARGIKVINPKFPRM